MVGPVDRVLGAGFGALKGLIGATLLYLGVNLVYDTIWGRAADAAGLDGRVAHLSAAPIEQRDRSSISSRRGAAPAPRGNEKRRERAMTEIRLHDTMAREKRVFTPADPERVTMYVCGPTVYNRAHIGNARPAVVFDVLARLLRHVYGEDSLVYARNVTDVDDKIIDAARGRGRRSGGDHRALRATSISTTWARSACRRPTSRRTPPQHIAEMIAMIARLIETGNAYEADGHVLFHVPSDPDYGALGRRDREAMIAGARVEVATYKKDPADFVLWKPSRRGRDRLGLALGPRPAGLAHRMLGDDRGASRRDHRHPRRRPRPDLPPPRERDRPEPLRP